MFLKDYCANLAFISSGIKAWYYPAVCCSVLTGNYWHQRCWGLHWRWLRCSREIPFDLSLLCCLKDPPRSRRSCWWLSHSALLIKTVNLSSRAWQIFCQTPLEDAWNESFSNFSGQLLSASWNISCGNIFHVEVTMCPPLVWDIMSLKELHRMNSGLLMMVLVTSTQSK